jgi:Spy/CpxP family protein refolding chaperone
MKKIMLTLMTVLVIAALTTTSFAYGWGQGMWSGRGPGYGSCWSADDQGLSGLNLTADQEAKIRSLREAQLKEDKPILDKMFSKRGELRLLWLQQNPDREKIVTVQKEIRSLRDQLQDKQTNNRLAVLKVLTPEQQTRIQAFGGGRGFGKGRGFGPGGGPGYGYGPGGYGLGPRGN